MNVIKNMRIRKGHSQRRFAEKASLSFRGLQLLEEEDHIVKESKERTGANYDQWTIGITDDPDPHRREFGFRGSWRHWETESPEISRRIKRTFLAKGMKDAGERGTDPRTVFIF